MKRITHLALLVLLIVAGGVAAAEQPAEQPTLFQICLKDFQVFLRIWSGLGLVMLYFLGGAAVAATGVLAASFRPAFFNRTADVAGKAPVRCGFLGAAVLVVILTIIGVLAQIPPLGPLTLLIMILGVLLLWCAVTVSFLVVGQRVLFAANSGKCELLPWSILTGGGLLVVLSLLPVLGWFTGSAIVLVSLGAIVAGALSRGTSVAIPPQPLPAAPTPRDEKSVAAPGDVH
ncbi:MAG TPA: hypothetical protein VGP72_14510 [Planctomycetota bacterium]|jgi:hypothetical protein